MNTAPESTKIEFNQNTIPVVGGVNTGLGEQPISPVELPSPFNSESNQVKLNASSFPPILESNSKPGGVHNFAVLGNPTPPTVPSHGQSPSVAFEGNPRDADYWSNVLRTAGSISA